MSPSEPRIPLPKSWPTHVRAAILHVIALAQFATAHTRSWAANSVNARIRLRSKCVVYAGLKSHRSTPATASKAPAGEPTDWHKPVA